MARPNFRPRSKPCKAPSLFLALPTELRLQIYNYLLLSVPTSYGYTHTDPPRWRRRQCWYPLRRHGMLLANHQLHAEYAQAFYERTNFFFYVDANNGTRRATTPFWTLPPALLPNLRQCKLYIELGVLALVPGLSMEALAARIEALLRRMERVRWVHLVWDLRGMVEQPIGERGWEERWEEQWWWRFGERSVQRLKGGAGMRGMIVTVGSRILRLERKGAEWVEREVVPY